MRLDEHLRAHGFLRVERPPLLWAADADAGPFGRLLDGVLALGRRRGNEPDNLTVNLANVTVGRTAAGAHLPVGEYVAVTVRGPGGWGPDARWWPGAAPAGGLLAELAGALGAAGARFAYARDLSREGSVTVYFGRLG